MQNTFKTTKFNEIKYYQNQPVSVWLPFTNIPPFSTLSPIPILSSNTYTYPNLLIPSSPLLYILSFYTYTCPHITIPLSPSPVLMLSSYLPLLNLYSYTFPSFFNTFPFLQSSSLIHILSFYILLHIYPPSSFSYASYPPTYFSYTYPILLSPSPKSVQSSNIVLLYLSFPKIPYLSINHILLCLSYPQIPISYIPILSSNPLLLYLLLPYLSVLLLLLCLS